MKKKKLSPDDIKRIKSLNQSKAELFFGGKSLFLYKYNDENNYKEINFIGYLFKNIKRISLIDKIKLMIRKLF